MYHEHTIYAENSLSFTVDEKQQIFSMFASKRLMADELSCPFYFDGISRST